MHLRSALVSVGGGVVAFFVATIAVTEALDPYVWPSVMLGLPIGVVLGLSTVALTYVGLQYRRERRAMGAVSTQTRRLLQATLAAVAAGVVVGGATVGGLATAALGLALALLVGLAVGLAAAAVATVLVWLLGRTGGERADAKNGRAGDG